MYSYSKPGHFTWTATLKQCGSLTNGGKREDESLQCSECTSSPAVGKSMLCVKKAHTGACTSKCLVLLSHSGLLLPLNSFWPGCMSLMYLLFLSLDRAINKNMICCRWSQATFTKCTSQPWNACLIIEILSPIDVVDAQTFACVLRHCLVISESAGWAELLSLPSWSWRFSWILGNHMECLKSHLLFSFNQAQDERWVISIDIIFILQPQLLTQQFSIFVLLAPTILFFTIHKCASQTSGYLSYGIM